MQSDNNYNVELIKLVAERGASWRRALKSWKKSVDDGESVSRRHQTQAFREFLLESCGIALSCSGCLPEIYRHLNAIAATHASENVAVIIIVGLS